MYRSQLADLPVGKEIGWELKEKNEEPLKSVSDRYFVTKFR
jgi:hypothetical protein